jgi:hypothetical protein
VARPAPGPVVAGHIPFSAPPACPVPAAHSVRIDAHLIWGKARPGIGGILNILGSALRAVAPCVPTLDAYGTVVAAHLAVGAVPAVTIPAAASLVGPEAQCRWGKARTGQCGVLDKVKAIARWARALIATENAGRPVVVGYSAE